MEINITSYFTHVHSNLCSGSMATHGKNVAQTTWANSMMAAGNIEKPLLSNPEEIKAFIEHMASMGFSDAEEMGNWPANEVQALFIQLISGDINENEHLSDDLDDCDFEAYEGDESTASSIFKGDDGQVYYYLGY